MEEDDMNNVLCIYHGGCSDGVAAAAVVKLWADKRHLKVCFHAATYGDKPPEVTEYSRVFVVDFSYPRAVMQALASQCKLIVYDHHKTAEADLDGFDFAVFDAEESGATLTWKQLLSERPLPLMLKYVRDRDLWMKELPHSKEVTAALRAQPLNPVDWADLILFSALHPSVWQRDMHRNGAAISQYRERCIEAAMLDEAMVDIADYRVPIVNATSLWSDIASRMAMGQPFAACYRIKGSSVTVDLRSEKVGLDVSEIAKMYGGGGHKHAAGFRMPVSWLVGVLSDG